MDLSGQRLGKYELIKRLGQGGMAEVYKAYQPTIERFVAVKVMHSHLAADERFLERFKREAKGLGQLRHPNIVNVIDFDSHEGRYFIVMDYVEGITLREYLDGKPVLPVDEALELAAQVADGLGYAHRRGSIHRDIKPANVIFADEAHTHLVITDFGIARLVEHTGLTLTGTIAGTPAYISPEVVQGHKADARSDIYSLGVMLYEMVTGRTPYSGDTPMSIMMKAVTQPLPSARELNPDLPSSVDAILSKALEKAPEKRYQTAAEFRQALLDGKAQLARRAREKVPSAGIHDYATVVERREPAAVPGVRPERAAPPRAASPREQPRAAPRSPTVHPKLARPKRGKRPLILAGLASLVLLVAALLALNGIGNPSSAPPPAEPTGEAEPTPTEAAEATSAAISETARPESTASAGSTVEQSPTATPAAAAEGGSLGSLHFTQNDGAGNRLFTLLLDGVSAPPPNFHYELWFLLSGQPAPHSAGTLDLQNGQIRLDGALEQSLAAAASGLLISIEPDFDDDPSASTDIAFEGNRSTAGDPNEILVFEAGD